MYEDCSEWICLYVLYGYNTNLPGGYADDCSTTTEENHLGGDEEAEVATKETESMVALTLDDPTSVYLDKGYFVTFTFYRRPEYQGQPLVLTTEFEIIEAYWDFQFDLVETTYRDEEF